VQVNTGERKLIAIFFSDIVRYSAISNANEPLALRLLEEHRALARPIIEKYGGTEIKTIGDGFLLTFSTVLSAVECGIEMLRVHKERNDKFPENQAIHLRIGIHLADVVFSGTDVYGDGVNIAFRLQGVGRPGTICLSGSVFYQVNQHITEKIFSIGRVPLKNIKSQVAIYVVAVAASERDLRDLMTRSQAERKKLPRLKLGFAISTAALISVLTGAGVWKMKLDQDDALVRSMRVAVLSFEGIGLKPEDQYLIDGLTEEVNSSLVKLGMFRVLARDSVKQWEKSPISELVRKLGVSTVVKGSLRKSDSKIFVNLHLIDGQSEETRWSKDLHCEAAELFNFQKKLASALGEYLRPNNRHLANAPGPKSETVPNSLSYEHFLRARHFMAQRTPKSFMQARKELEKAIDSDPSYAAAYALLTNVYSLQYYYGSVSPIEAGRKVFEFGEKALSLDPSNNEALLSIAEAYAYIHHDWKKADELFQKALANSADHATTHQWYAEFLSARGKFEEAYTHMEKAITLNPESLVMRCASANVRFQGGDYEQSMSEAVKTISLDPNMMIAHYWYGRSALELGHVQVALASLSLAAQLSGRSSMTLAALGYALARSGQTASAREILKELLQKKGSEYYSSYDLATLYAGLNQIPEMIRALRSAYVERSSYLMLIRNDPAFKRHLGNSNYQNFLQNMPF